MKKVLLVLTAGLLMWSCDKSDDPVKGEISVDTHNVMVATSAATTETIQVTANSSEWTATSENISWLTVSPASGSASGAITLTIAENKEATQRSAQVVITGTNNAPTQYVNVSQAASGQTVVVSPTSVNVGGEGATVQVLAASLSGMSVSFSAAAGWIDTTSTRMVKNGTTIASYILSVKPNTDVSPRSVNFVVTPTTGNPVSVAVAQTAVDAQRTALLSIKAAFTGTTWSMMTWDESKPYSQWDGVTVDAANNVTGLDFNYKGQVVSGKVSSSFAVLTSLKALKIQSTTINDTIKTQFVGLSNLETLFLSCGANFRWDLSACPVTAYTNLKSLTLKDNVDFLPKNADGPTKPFSDLVSLPNLKSLVIATIKPTDLPTPPGTYTYKIAGIPSLEYLEVADAKFEGVVTTATAFTNLKSVRIPSNANGITGEGIAPLFTTTLESFYMNGYANMTAIPTEVGNATNLKSLTFMGIYPITNAIPSSISSCTQLERLQISGNGQLNTTIPSLANMSKLHYLNLGGNAGVTGSFPTLHASAPIDTLILNGTVVANGTGIGLDGAIPALGSYTKLRELQLQKNNFTGSVPDLSACANLGNANFQLNKLTGIIMPNNAYFNVTANQNNVRTQQTGYTVLRSDNGLAF